MMTPHRGYYHIDCFTSSFSVPEQWSLDSSRMNVCKVKPSTVDAHLTHAAQNEDADGLERQQSGVKFAGQEDAHSCYKSFRTLRQVLQKTLA